MAQRRMFSKSITNSSRFLMMPQSAQNLYFHLGMNADDDGFCEHFTIMRMTESKPDDLKILQAKRFIHIFDDRVLVIMEWKENNHIQKDRYTPSKYLETYKNEIKMLSEGGSDVYKMDTQDRLGKDRLVKDSIEFSDENSLNVNQLLVDYFFELKGIPDMPTESYEKNNIIFARCAKDAKNLLDLCDNDLGRAKICLDKTKNLVSGYCEDWQISTAIKKFLELK